MYRRFESYHPSQCSQPDSLPEPSVLLKEDTRGIAVKILVLPGPQRPDEASQCPETKKQRAGHEDDQNVHARIPRMELTITVTELVDMAIAAASGVANPRTAMGTAIAL